MGFVIVCSPYWLQGCLLLFRKQRGGGMSLIDFCIISTVVEYNGFFKIVSYFVFDHLLL